MQKKQRQSLLPLSILSTTICLVLSLAACTGGANDTPGPTEEVVSMTSMEYLESAPRVELISDAFNEAELKIVAAQEAGTLTVNEADASTDADSKRRIIKVAQDPELTIFGPIKGDQSLWVITFEGKSSTIETTSMDTAKEIENHDLRALAALESFVNDLG